MKPTLSAIGDNKSSFEKLLSVREDLVPFIGAGFSCPVCPAWGVFLDDYLESIKHEFLTEAELIEYQTLQASDDSARYEKMADFLVNKSERRKFAEQLQDKFGQICPPEQQHKFHLLHRAFPGLKVTTNYDQLIEDHHPHGKHVEIARGNRPEDLERLFTKGRVDCLLKIHGGLRDSNSIVLASQQYQEIYGAEQGFDENASLPAFLRRLFSNSSVLFIGCSLENDRVLAVLQKLSDVRPHFALMKRPKQQQQVVSINRRLSGFQITPIWFQDYDDIPELLQCLAPMAVAAPAIESISSFVGRKDELQQIEQALTSQQGNVQMISGRLFNIEGAGGVGKTTLALKAAERFGHLAKAGVLGPFRADEMNAQTFAVALAHRLNIPIEAPVDNASAQTLISQMLQDQHCLIILDNAVDWHTLRYMLPKQSPATLIVTTRDRDMGTRLRSHFKDILAIDDIQLHHFTPEEALNLFRELLMDKYQEADQPQYETIAKELGYLPIALRQVIALINYSPHYSARQVVEKLAHDGRLAVLRKGQAVDGSDERSIDAVFDLASPALSQELLEGLQYLAVCAPGPVTLSFLQQLTDNPNIDEILEQLHTYNWCERRDGVDQRHYELHQLVRELIIERYGKTFTKQFMATVDAIFLDETIHFSVKDGLIAQLNEALVCAEASKDKLMLDWISPLAWYCLYRGHFNFYVQLTEIIERTFVENKGAISSAIGNRALILKAWGKLDEAMALLQKQQSLCDTLGDQAGLSISYGNQALILQAWGKLDEAMALHQKQQSLCDTLGDQAGLSKSYGNQALILKAWGKLDEAMALHQKQQSLCETLGDQAGLSKSYCGQALILKAWGKLDEAMALYQKEQSLCETLGDQAGLSRSYGNQALILRAWGKLDEAMALLQKQQSLKEALGDQAGLSRSYGNQALILKAWGKLDEAMALLQKQQSLKEALGDQAGLAISYGNQALILQAWGKLDEAMALHQKEQSLCETLGDQAGLARSYGNQALILGDWGKLDEAMALHQKEQSLCETLGDQAGLSRSYGNQALILKAWGKLDEAMALHQKQQSLCETLGDQAGLARSYNNQALILKAWGKLDEAMALHQKEQSLKEALGDQAGLARSYGNQALILQAWGKLDEAMALHQKQQSLCETLGDQAGLARSWWNQGSIYGQQGLKDQQIELWKRSIDINQRIGIPTEDNEIELNKLLDEP